VTAPTFVRIDSQPQPDSRFDAGPAGRNEPTDPSSRLGFVPGLLTVLAVNIAVVVVFHDASWIPADDGHYLHVADRLANGQVLNRDVEELHPGYVHFLHAWSLDLFGQQAVSLRYPLMALTVLQSVGVFLLFRSRGVRTATTAAIVVSAIGVFQIANPTTSLYALAASILVAAIATKTNPETRHRALLLGLGLGLVFLFRQLTAVFVAMGLLAFLLGERRSGSRPSGSDALAARCVFATTALGLVGYLVTTTDTSAAVLFGVWPLALLLVVARRPAADNGVTMRTVAGLLAGSVASALPLVGYHLMNGSLGAWLNDTFLRSLSITDLDHLTTANFVRDLGVRSIGNLLIGSSLTARFNGVYWLVLIGVAFALGAATFARGRGEFGGFSNSFAVPLIALFHALVAVFNQIPFYLYLGVGFSIIGLLWLKSTPASAIGPASPISLPLTVGALALALVAITSHAGQPYTRSWQELADGTTRSLTETSIDRLGLRIDPTEAATYDELLAVIDEATSADDAIFTAPNNADLYFLADRSNPFRMFNPTISLLNGEERAAFIDAFEAAKPTLFIHDERSHYNTKASTDLIATLTADYDRTATIERFAVYVRPGSGH